jgi:hypothetical protein
VSKPTALLSADFNHDGHLDIATANDGSSNILHPGRVGEWNAQRAGAHRGRAAPPGDRGRPPRRGRHRGSRHRQRGLGNISVLLGKAGHGFEEPVDYVVGSGPTSVALADMDADGWLDVIVSKTGGTITSLLNQGDGALGSPITSLVQGSRGLAVGYLNGEQVPRRCGGQRLLDSVSIFIGQGGGVLGAPVHVPVDASPKQAVMGDLDGDGDTDVAVSCLAGVVSVLLGDGNGGVAPAINYAMPNGAWGLGLAGRERGRAVGRPRRELDQGLRLGGAQRRRLADRHVGGLRSGLAGTSGTPILSGIGSLVPGSHGALKLAHSRAPRARPCCFVSLTSTPTPFKCGSLVPVPVLGQFLLPRSEARPASVLAGMDLVAGRPVVRAWTC